MRNSPMRTGFCVRVHDGFLSSPGFADARFPACLIGLWLSRLDQQMARGKGLLTAGRPDKNWKRERKVNYGQHIKLPNVDVHGILFAVVAVVFVVYPLAQYFLGL